jgi:minor extracellular serine protease Vpr
MLIYDNVDGAPITPSLGDVQITAPFITQADGLAIKKAILADPSITLTFSDQYYNFPSPTGGLISDFSSWGLTNDNYIKPTIAAPGGSILSTWPVAKGSYNQISGTSMACPFITGFVALYISHNGAGGELYCITGLPALFLSH